MSDWSDEETDDPHAGIATSSRGTRRSSDAGRGPPM